MQMKEDHTFSAEDSFGVGEPVRAEGKSMLEQSRQNVEPKATKILNFYVELDKPGVYLYTFMSPIEGSDRAWMVKRFEVVP